ncbi:MAG: family 16 glycoside hydrolase [Bryobacteraceae bacterium]
MGYRTAICLLALLAMGIAQTDSRVEPILRARCLPCHNARLKDGGISFEDRDSLLKGGPHVRAMVPGKPEASMLVHAVRQDGEVKMPPGSKLSNRDIATLTNWIAGGGQWVTKQSFTGRWDLTIQTPRETYPSWMEVAESAEVKIVGQVAGVHPGSGVSLSGSRLSFSTLEYFGKQRKVAWDIVESGGRLTGTQTRDDGTIGRITGERAPAMDRQVADWGDPQPLFNGKDLSGWEPLVTEPGKAVANHYRAIDGELVNTAPGANIGTTRRFQDFKLHVEYNCPREGNSGVYLRGRYEVQVEYEAADKNDPLHGMGSIYGFLAPEKPVPPRPGTWETFDITLVGRNVTIVRDGTTIVDRRQIPGITGGALDSHEAEPGPIYIQGDHTGGMKYRNITISVGK